MKCAQFQKLVIRHASSLPALAYRRLEFTGEQLTGSMCNVSIGMSYANWDFARGWCWPPNTPVCPKAGCSWSGLRNSLSFETWTATPVLL